MHRREQPSTADAGPDFAAAVTWLKRHQVLVAGLLLVAASIAWKAQFLHRRYFYQDDFVDLDVARRSPFNWHYLSRLDPSRHDHFFPGFQAVTWVLAKISLYNWGLDSAVLLAFAAAASVAALLALRTLFGERPAILLPLVVYLVIPLTVPDLGWWGTGMESQPFQLAIFMMLGAHVRYVRSGGARHLSAAIGWLIFGMLFFEKSIALPLLLFAITSGYMADRRSWLGGMVHTLRQHWRAWLSYAVLLVAYSVVAIEAFRASASKPHPATSGLAVRTFTSYFVKDNLLPGIFGGPWRWIPAGAGSRYAIALPTMTMVRLSEVGAVLLLLLTIWVRPVGWRAWLIFVVWVALADMAPIIFGRLGFGLTVLFALETRYLADAAPVLAICLGLVLLPVAAVGERAAAVQKPRRLLGGRIDLRPVAAALIATFIVSAIWSDQTYENITNGGPLAAAYIANAGQGLTHAAPGTFVLDQAMPTDMVEQLFGSRASQSQVIGDLVTGVQARRLHWIKHAVGTLDDLKMIGSNGQLLPAYISGVYTIGRKGPGLKACWPSRGDRIIVKFPRSTTPYPQTLRISYIWSGSPGFVVIQYGDSAQRLYLSPGLHNAYLQVTGAVTALAIDGQNAKYLCVGSAEAGQLVPY